MGTHIMHTAEQTDFLADMFAGRIELSSNVLGIDDAHTWTVDAFAVLLSRRIADLSEIEREQAMANVCTALLIAVKSRIAGIDPAAELLSTGA